MNTTLAKPTYEITIANKVYPKPDERVLTPAFETMAGRLIASHQLDGRNIYPEFGRRLQTFNDTFAQTKDFLTGIIRSNMQGNDRAAIDGKMTKVRNQMQKVTFAPPPGLTAEVAICDPQTRLAKLNGSVALNVTALLYFLAKSLDELVHEEQVGLIEWFSDDVCRFHFYLNSYKTRATILNRTIDVKGQTFTESWTRQTTRTEDRQRHQHDLVEANLLDIGTYVPYRVERLIELIPASFRPFFRVVKGQQIYEHVVRETTTTVETQGESRSWTVPLPEPPQSVWVYDPALIIGHYVVAGWGESEEKESRRIDIDVCRFRERNPHMGLSQFKMARHVAHLTGAAASMQLLGNVRNGNTFRSRYLELAY